MNGSGPTPAEQHLGDRLAALVDGELKHDARDRVLAHLATCPKCKAEADAQRRLKDVFARTAPPPPSEGLLARLQGLPAGPGAGRGPFDGAVIDTMFGEITPAGSAASSSGRPGGRRSETFGYLPGAHTGGSVLAGGSPGVGGAGFRIHDVGREAERSPWRGRRFAFAAASAVSFAAIALGGALPLEASLQSTRGGSGSTTPLRAAPTTGSGSTGSTLPTTSTRGMEQERRRGGQTSVQMESWGGYGTVPGLLLPGAALTPPPLAPPLLTPPSHRVPPLKAPMGGAAFVQPPLIRPTGSAFQHAAAPAPHGSATPRPSQLVAPTQPEPPLLPPR
ncbi:anti-sigma factor family protein [Streptomyces sp. NPDC057638]|uniref:anti-sigma factor family protein n=1 Tax=Streptomyces sp. NPDC057638 TaxID=3346190 RepID=UPI00368068B1